MKIKEGSDLYDAIEHVIEMLYNCDIELDKDPYRTTEEVVDAMNKFLNKNAD